MPCCDPVAVLCVAWLSSVTNTDHSTDGLQGIAGTVVTVVCSNKMMMLMLNFVLLDKVVI